MCSWARSTYKRVACGPGDELHSRERLHIEDELFKVTKRPLARIRRPQRIDLPLLARRIGAAGKVHVPELTVDELAWMKIKANQPPAAHLLVELAELGLTLFEVSPLVIGPELWALFGMEDIEQPAVIASSITKCRARSLRVARPTTTASSRLSRLSTGGTTWTPWLHGRHLIFLSVQIRLVGRSSHNSAY